MLQGPGQVSPPWDPANPCSEHRALPSHANSPAHSTWHLQPPLPPCSICPHQLSNEAALGRKPTPWNSPEGEHPLSTPCLLRQMEVEGQDPS